MDYRKYKWLLIGTVIVAAALILLAQPWKGKKYDISSLLPDDTGSIERIRVNGIYDTLIFVKKDTLWYSGGELMYTRSVNNLLLAASHLQKSSIVPRQDIAPYGYSVQFRFYGKKKELSCFRFAASEAGYYIFGDQSEYAYGVELSGYEDYPLEKIFSSNADHYRKHQLISLMPSEVSEVVVSPIVGRSFLVRQHTDHSIDVFDGVSGENITDALDSIKIRMLLSYFNIIRFGDKIEQGELSPSAIPETPISVISVKDFEGNAWKFEVFLWTRDENEAPDMFESLVIFNDSKEYYSINYYYLDLLMRGLKSYQ
ncbi:MAG: hypothetical protein K9J30_05860 [Bacteroidales bacterium]|nr:hypothetical protein [Bacteroidales bacterium]